MSNMKGIRQRFDAQVAAGTLEAETASAIYGESPLHAQADSRSGKLWMVSHPFAITDGGVELLL